MINQYVPGARASGFCSDHRTRKDGWSLLSYAKKVDQTNMRTMWKKIAHGRDADVHVFNQERGIIYFDCRSGKIARLNQLVRDWKPPGTNCPTGPVAAPATGHWTKVLSNGGSYGTTDVGAARFNAMFKAGGMIVKRVCSNCAADYKEMYYRRYSSPDNVNVYDLMKQNWFSRNNVLNRDFGIFSSYADAQAKRNSWRFCNYNDPGVGFPRDCGKARAVGGQWNAFAGSRHLRGSRTVAYYIQVNDCRHGKKYRAGGERLISQGKSA